MQQLEQQHAHAQLPQTGTGGIERPRRRRLAHAQHGGMQQRRHADQCKQAQADPAPVPAARPGQEQQREQQVKLLFHTQRPGMGIRIELGSGREIVVADGRQHPVAETEEGHQTGLVAGLAEPGFGDEQHACHGGQQQAGQQRRGDAADAARIEAQHRLPQRKRRQPMYGRADHETGDDEEHVNAGEPARQPGRGQVEHDDRQHGDRTQTIDMREISGTAFLHDPAPDMQRAPFGAQCVQQWSR
ncbi:hypothetical protein D3C72_842210 [compost metagenome]